MAKRAVLIGINDYADPAVNDLHGCVNDVTLMGEVLTDTFGFDDVSRVVDPPGNTRDGIFAALDGLIDATEQGDVAVLFYSGHGSQAPDVSGDEGVGELDETIVPSDSGRGSLPVRDIIDDELNSYLAALGERTDRAYFIFDSCHSGSIDRDLLAAERAIAFATTAPEGEPRLRPETGDVEGARSASGIVSKGAYVLVAGCLDHQTSKETDFEGQRNGALTHFLTRELLSDPDITLKAAFDGAAAAVKQMFNDQDAVLEGPDHLLTDRPF